MGKIMDEHIESETVWNWIVKQFMFVYDFTNPFPAESNQILPRKMTFELLLFSNYAFN